MCCARMNIPPYALQGAIRFSLSRENTEDDVSRVLAALPAIVAHAREKSPLWAEIRPSQVHPSQVA